MIVSYKFIFRVSRNSSQYSFYVKYASWKTFCSSSVDLGCLLFPSVSRTGFMILRTGPGGTQTICKKAGSLFFFCLKIVLHDPGSESIWDHSDSASYLTPISTYVSKTIKILQQQEKRENRRDIFVHFCAMKHTDRGESLTQVCLCWKNTCYVIFIWDDVKKRVIGVSDRRPNSHILKKIPQEAMRW